MPGKPADPVGPSRASRRRLIRAVIILGLKDQTVTVRANRQKKVTARHRPEPTSKAAANAEDSDGQAGESAAAPVAITTMNSRAPALAVAGPRHAEAVLVGSQRARRRAVRTAPRRTRSNGRN